MADRIFPNKFQESGIDSELVFTGINWDTFNERLAKVMDGESDEKKKVPHELLDALNEKYPEEFDEEAKSNDREGGNKWAAYAEDEDEDDHSGMQDMGYCPDCKEISLIDGECEQCGYNEDEEDEEEAEMEKRASKIVFNHPSQLSAEAVEAAIASGDKRLANTILAARHERRVRLATQIETNIKTAQAHQDALMQRRAYRENLVRVAAQNEKRVAVAQKQEVVSSRPTFVKASSLNNTAKQAFAAKAIAAGFPTEYVEAMLNTPAAEAPAVNEIKQVMASNLNPSTKKQVVASMIKESALDSANINRCKDYWKNELGYGDPEWVDELFNSK